MSPPRKKRISKRYQCLSLSPFCARSVCGIQIERVVGKRVGGEDGINKMMIARLFPLSPLSLRFAPSGSRKLLLALFPSSSSSYSSS